MYCTIYLCIISSLKNKVKVEFEVKKNFFHYFVTTQEKKRGIACDSNVMLHVSISDFMQKLQKNTAISSI